MENKELITNVTYNESGIICPIDESVISFLQILIPKPTTSDARDDEPLSYKNCNSFELIYDNRQPQILYYLGDYMYDAEANSSRFLSCLPNINFEGTTVGDGGDLTEMYKACEAIKKWAENTMYLIGEKYVKVINNKINEEIEADCEESRRHILGELYKLGLENIKNNTPDPDQEYVFNCNECSYEFKFNIKNDGIKKKFGNTTFTYVKCPKCGEENIIGIETDASENNNINQDKQ